MQYTEFIQQVKSQANIESDEQAEQAIEATLETLGERLSRTEQENLAAQVVNELKEMVLKRTDVHSYNLEEFYNRVTARADIGYPDAVKRSQAVVNVLTDAISQGEIEDILSEIDKDFGELFGIESPGPASPSSVT
ncbi:MAG: DUF2267 domain-containing protein [Candidatus Marinimicrobia bacterium]|nr:DUF2267 domain-containing protein [Candidatus Neomarinimicrobiota bacterium]